LESNKNTLFKTSTPPKITWTSKNTPLQKEKHLQTTNFQVPAVSFQGIQGFLKKMFNAKMKDVVTTMSSTWTVSSVIGALSQAVFPYEGMFNLTTPAWTYVQRSIWWYWLLISDSQNLKLRIIKNHLKKWVGYRTQKIHVTFFQGLKIQSPQ